MRITIDPNCKLCNGTGFKYVLTDVNYGHPEYEKDACDCVEVN